MKILNYNAGGRDVTVGYDVGLPRGAYQVMLSIAVAVRNPSDPNSAEAAEAVLKKRLVAYDRNYYAVLVPSDQWGKVSGHVVKAAVRTALPAAVKALGEKLPRRVVEAFVDGTAKEVRPAGTLRPAGQAALEAISRGGGAS